MKLRYRRQYSDWLNPKRVKGWLECFDLKVRPSSRLKMRVYIFETREQLIAFYKQVGLMPKATKKGFSIGGFVWSMSWNVTTAEGEQIAQVDPEYFAVMGLWKGGLDTETVTHECVHAGFAYAKRLNRAFDWRAFDFDEENVCYPTGLLMYQLAMKIMRSKALSLKS